MSEQLDRFERVVASATERPVHHLKAGAKVTPPYICWYVKDDLNLYADNEIYAFLGYRVIVEVYERKDGEGLRIVDEIRKAGYSCTIKDDNWLSQENIWITIIEVVISV